LPQRLYCISVANRSHKVKQGTASLLRRTNDNLLDGGELNLIRFCKRCLCSKLSPSNPTGCDDAGSVERGCELEVASPCVPCKLRVFCLLTRPLPGLRACQAGPPLLAISPIGPANQLGQTALSMGTMSGRASVYSLNGVDPLTWEEGLVEKDVVRLFACGRESTCSADDGTGDDDMEMAVSAVSP
jgi:hypothetical protein